MENRRRYYRIQFARAGRSVVKLFMETGMVVEAGLLDFSAGGLRCRPVGHRIPLLKTHHFFEKIFIYPRELNRPIRASGVLSRIFTEDAGRRVEWAIEFSAVYSEHHLMEEMVQSVPVSSPVKQPRHFLARLKQSANPYTTSHLVRKQKRRLELYAAFKDIAANLSAGERWWFYCILESLKSADTVRQKGLVAEYLKYCRRPRSENESSSNPPSAVLRVDLD